MKFLQKHVFYPDDYNEQTQKRMDEQRQAYFEYLEKIADKLPKSLYSAYMRTNGFHDYAVKRITVNGDAWCYWKKSDVVILEVRFEKTEYSITFNGITYLKLLNEFQDTCWHGKAGSYNSSLKQGLEEIVLCELGLIAEGEYSFEFFTSSGAIFEVRFQQVKVAKRKIYY